MAPVQDQPDENISWRILVGTIVSIVPATICVILRFIARHVACAGLWWDDYTIAVSLIPLYDYGRHAQYVSAEKVKGFGKSFMAVQLVYFTNAVITKASLLLLFHRIFGVVRGFRWILWVSAFLVVAYFIVCSIVSIVGCSPVSKSWDKSQPGHCIDEVAFFRWNGVGNMLLDFLVLCLPFPMAWRVNTTIRQKCILTGIFLLGGFVCVVSILRIVSFESAALNDPTFTSVGPETWSSVEQSVGIMCACLPTLRPLFRRLYGPPRTPSERVSSAPDSQNKTSRSSRMSTVDGESSIVGFAPSSSRQQHERRSSSLQLDEFQGTYRSPTSDETRDRPISQSTQISGINKPVSTAGSFA
ncbi:hypothetical protein N7519_009005 [Penicillium mononematosum]|uniref:uncharacterized protein n=1 Tax=Penicillium mononematosum TaxID=268346 RepID=UPI002547DC25|nr:uncharacterized protein N7519_009005 [Penicillium mononematosum]KAJ6178544.1 hypothetical protein N7519_009005 [Penicillium mononematosum]